MLYSIPYINKLYKNEQEKYVFFCPCFFDNITLNELSKKATVAQLAEHLICNQRVGGSIPFGASIKISKK